MWRKGFGLFQVFNLDHRVSAHIYDLERPGLDVLLDGGVVVSSSDQAPLLLQFVILQVAFNSYLTSKIVFAGFIAAWFFAASPMSRSSSVKETKDGVVNDPCSFATIMMVNLHGMLQRRLTY